MGRDFACPAEGCGGIFKNASGLSRHKKTCSRANAGPRRGPHNLPEALAVPKPSKTWLMVQRVAAVLANSEDTAPDQNVMVPPVATTYNEITQSEDNYHVEVEPVDMTPIENRPPSPSPPPPPPPQLTRSGRPRREYKLPKRFVQLVPEPPAPLPEPEQEMMVVRRVVLIVRDYFKAVANKFGVWREYPRRPSYDPDMCLDKEDLADTQTPPPLEPPDNPPPSDPSSSPRPSYWPYKNITVQKSMAWLNNGNTRKSEVELNDYVHSVILTEEFDPAHLEGFDAHRENMRMDKALEKTLKSKFKECSVKISVPSGDTTIPEEDFSIPGLLYRNLTSVIAEAFTGPLGYLHHFSPYQHMYTSPLTQMETRIFDEIYTSDAFMETYEDIQRHGKLPLDDPECKREKVVAALMFSSDATHLTSFGNAKAWPIYLMLGNLSKYIRAKPNSGAMHHLAYIPSLPDSFQDFAQTFCSKWRSQKDAITTHCRRELMHAVWKIILDDEFVNAYNYGIVVMCSDGVERRIYPRIFTYSADYPEKVLLATIRDKGLCPCIRCYVLKTDLDQMGQHRDMKMRDKIRTYMKDKIEAARKAIYKEGKGIKSNVVEILLKPFSLVPTKNAFVEKLGDDFNPMKMLVVDLLHEFEIGVWKAVFTHLIRVLYAAGRSESDELVAELDRRYRQMSTFGAGTIRMFANNTSEMKKLAARDFEDMLQCAIPAFEGLLEGKADRDLMKLLYKIAEWHGLAKLRMHTEPSLELLETLTKEFGNLTRGFRKFTHENYDTVELPREADARRRREMEKVKTAAAVQEGLASNPLTAPDGAPTATPEEGARMPPPIETGHTMLPEGGPAMPQQARTEPSPAAPKSGRKSKKLNLNTAKFHFLGDYVRHIRLFGTTDSYSTQLGELAHRLLKAFYALTNKKDATKQMAKKYSRREALRAPLELAEIKEALTNARQDEPYYISNARNHPLNLFEFALAKPRDPAKHDFVRNLQNHVFGRLTGQEFDGDDVDLFTPEDRNSLRFIGGRIFRHATTRINYTTYDMRRSYDTINPRSHPFIMLASPETEPGAHPFWYAQVLGIFHAQVLHVGPKSRDPRPQHIDFLWVRWLGLEPGRRFGHKLARLPKIGFVPEDDDYAFGFVDPALVLRGCHLLPAFADGRTNILLGTQEGTEARKSGEKDDWLNYYVGIFVDRDMLMRHLGLGIGHEGQTNRDHESTQEDLQGVGVDADEDQEGGWGEEEEEEEEEGEEGELSDGDYGYDDL